MQQPEAWVPGKFILQHGRLRAHRGYVHAGSLLMAERIAAFYQDALPRFAGGRLGDLGCGHVPLYPAYRDRVDTITCVDWANTGHRNVHLDLEADLSRPLPLPEASFDTIILSDVLEHIPEPAVLWSELARLLAPGGHLLLNVPFFYHLHEQPHDYHRYTEFALRRAAEQVGMTVVDLRSLGGAADVLTDLTGKLLIDLLPRGGHTLARTLQAVMYRLLLTWPGRWITRQTASTYPLAYGLVARKPAA